MTSTESNLISSYKKMFGLSNVDDTSDKQKPISDLTKVALDTKLNLMGGILTGNLTGTTANFSNQLTSATGTFNNDVQFNGNVISTSETVTFSDVQINDNLSGTSGIFTSLVNVNNINGSNGTFTNGFTSSDLNLVGDLTGSTATFSGVDRSNGEILVGGLTGTTATFSGDIIVNISGYPGISMSNLSSQIQTLQNTVNSTSLNNLPNYNSDLYAYNNGLNINSLYLKNSSINVLKNGFNSLYKFNWIDSNSQKCLISNTYPNYTNLANNSVTFEIWIYPYFSSSSTTPRSLETYLFDNRSNTSSGFALGIYRESNGITRPHFFSEGNNEIINGITFAYGLLKSSGGPTITYETWNHIAYVFNRSTVKVYLNGGECIYTNTVWGSRYTTNTSWSSIMIGNVYNYIGREYYFNGYIGGIRISNTVLYNSAGFTPPTFFSKMSSTVFLLGPNFKEHVNGNQITIYGTNGNDITVSYSIPNTSNSYYQTAYKMSSINLLQMYGSFYDLSSNSWTIECWIKTNAINTNNPIIISLNNGNSWFKIIMSSTGFITFNVPSSIPYLTGTTVLVANKWTHIALSRNKTTITLYINGTNCASSTTMPNLSSVIFDNISIGNAWDATGIEQTSTFDGLISQVHISKKVLYSANFIPQFGLYPSDISSAIFYLSNNYNDVITGKSLRVGNPSIFTF